MKITRKIAQNPFMAIFMSGLILFTTSCTKDTLNPTSAGNSKYADYSGEDIFKGLFFFQNELSNDVSHVKEIKSEMNDLVLNGDVKLTAEKSNLTEKDINTSIKEMSDITISYISKNYPTFFDEFEQVMKSGNFYEMERVMDLSSQLIDQSLLSSEKYQAASIINKEMGKDPELKEQILALDLTKKEDTKKLEILLNSVEGLKGEVHQKAAAFVTVLAVAYVAVGAVSFVVAAYSVVTKAAYWDPTTVASPYSSKVAIANISRALSIK
jgi:hypothetical protein